MKFNDKIDLALAIPMSLITPLELAEIAANFAYEMDAIPSEALLSESFDPIAMADFGNDDDDGSAEFGRTYADIVAYGSGQIGSEEFAELIRIALSRIIAQWQRFSV